MLIASKRNHLREMAAEDLGIVSKPSKSPGTNESTENNYGAEMRPPNSGGQQSPQNLLNTPLANAMKKVGMTPVLNNHLNDLVKKKVVLQTSQGPSNGFNSNSGSPKTMSVYEDGTSGGFNVDN